MINVYSSLMSAWPASVVLSPKLSRVTPSFSQVWDYERISPASAVGNTMKSVQGSIGEYFERRHFFNEIHVLSRKTIQEMLPAASADAFLFALSQTSLTNADKLKTHKFSTVPAFNAFTLEQVEIPAVIVALDNITARDDLEFFPTRDTCGCSCHVSLNKAIDGALGELIERQSLLMYWLTGFANYDLIIDGSIGVNYIDDLIESLRSDGELVILDITMPGVPGYAILTLYGSSHLHGTIKYSTGLSYADTLQKALHKSLIELWQSYICMHNFITGGYSTEDIIDSYQSHFLACNKYETFIELKNTTKYKFFQKNLSTVLEDKNGHGELIDCLEKISPNLYMYYARDKTSAGFMWYIKALSPDFFLHMNNGGSINLNNKIYKSGDGIIQREKIMVPFP